jgi:hypothetical protein
MAEFPLPEQPVQSHAGSTLNFDAVRKRITKIEAGGWVAVTLGAKVESDPSYQSVKCRKEQGEAVVRLRGAPRIKGGETLEPGETLFTLSEGFRPPATINIFLYTDTSVFGALEIAATGVATYTGKMVATAFIALDGVTFNLT